MKSLTELRFDRAKLMTDAQTIARNGVNDAETRTKVQQIMTDVEQIEADIKVAERLEAFTAEQRNAQRPPRAEIGTAVEADKTEQRDNLIHYMRTGEVRAGLTTVSGAPAIPTGFAGILAEAAASWGQLAAAVKQWNTASGESIRYATADDTENQFSIIGEATAVTEADPTLAGVTSNVSKFQSGLVLVSSEMLADASFDLESWLRNEFSKRYYRGVTAAINAGATNITSIQSVAEAGLTTASPTDITYTEIAELIGKLEPAYANSASIVLNSRSRAYFLGQVDGMGRPLYVVNANSGQLDHIAGLPVVINQGQADIAAGASPILVGSLTDSYVLRTAGPVLVRRLNERFADTDQVGFVAFARIGGFGFSALADKRLLKLTMHA